MRLNLTGKAGIPAVGLAHGPQRFDLASEGAMLPHGDPTDAQHAQAATIEFEPIAVLSSRNWRNVLDP
ncbi:MAG: hypothetical protein HY782_25485 [Chloroflexi bacterium]|nr:hypothetical protein [Chloroflexota bacterium]